MYSPTSCFILSIQTREALGIAQKELEVRNSLTPLPELQRWLQISYELELKAYNEKKTLAEQQLLNAKVHSQSVLSAATNKLGHRMSSNWSSLQPPILCRS